MAFVWLLVGGGESLNFAGVCADQRLRRVDSSGGFAELDLLRRKRSDYKIADTSASG